MARAPLRIVCTNNEIFVSRTDADLGKSAPWHAFYIGSEGKLKFGQKAAAPPSTAVTRTLDADAIYGAFSLLHGYYVSFVTRSRAVGPGPNDSTVFQVLHMECVPVVISASAGGQSSARSGGIAGSSHPLTKAEEEEEEVYLRLLRQISETKSFYFAQGYDITNTLQRNDAIAAAHQDGASASASSSSAGAGADQASTPSAPRPSWLHADDRFFWNKSASRELIAANAHDFVTPIINGFVGCTDVSQFALSLLLVSRRACTRQGTRFNMRGADADGNVANYAETEQLLLFGSGAVSSFTQIRGSIPLLWEQPVTMKYTPRCVVSGKTESSFSAFQKHMGQQLDRYGRVHVVSLIDKKGDQKVLGTAYMSACEKYGDEARLGNTWFDFHAETKGKAKWAALSKLMDAVDPALNSHGFYLRDATGRVVNQQHGVARTNCMDNLDRTNVVQSLFARRAALSAIPGALEQTKAAACSVLTSPFPGFEHAFNNLWADNADALSILYSGTGALKTDFTRTGKRTLQGAINDGINSVTRYVLNNLVDGRTQDAWDLFLGRYVPERSRSEREGVLASSAGSGAASGSGGKGKKEDKVSPVRAHMLEVTPMSFLLRTAVVFVTLTATIAHLATASHQPLLARVAWGMAGASLILGGMAYMITGKGLKAGRSLVSKPNFCPTYSHHGRDPGLVGGLHTSEPTEIADTAQHVPVHSARKSQLEHADSRTKIA